MKSINGVFVGFLDFVSLCQHPYYRLSWSLSFFLKNIIKAGFFANKVESRPFFTLTLSFFFLSPPLSNYNPNFEIMGKPVWNDLARLVALTAATYAVWADIWAIAFPKFMFDMIGGTLGPHGIM